MVETEVPINERYPNYETALAAISQLEEELQEFQRSSYELEGQLEEELQHLEEDNRKLLKEKVKQKDEITYLKNQIVQVKQDEAVQKKELSLNITTLEHKLIKTQTKLIETEIENDSIQQTERAQASLILELQTDLQSQQEKNIILEIEIEKVRTELISVKLENSNLHNQVIDTTISHIKPQNLVLSTPVAQQTQHRVPSVSSSSSGRSSNDDENVVPTATVQSMVLSKIQNSKLPTPLTPLAAKSLALNSPTASVTPTPSSTQKKITNKRHSSPVMSHLHNLIHRQSNHPNQTNGGTPSRVSTVSILPRTVSSGSSSNPTVGLLLPKKRSAQTTTKITGTNVLTASTHIRLDTIPSSNSNSTQNNISGRHSSMNHTQHSQSQMSTSPPSLNPISLQKSKTLKIASSPSDKAPESQETKSPINTDNSGNNSRLKSLQRRISGSKFLNWIGDSNSPASPNSPDSRSTLSSKNGSKETTPVSKRFNRFSLDQER